MSKRKTPTEAERSKVYKEFMEDLNKETDRGCALVGAAYLDEALENLLRARFVAEDGAEDKVLGMYRGLGSFASRIEVAYRIGLIGKGVLEELRHIKEVRNQFAHRHEVRGFDAPEVKELCQKLHIAKDLVRYGSLTNRDRYAIAVAMLASLLVLWVSSAERIKEAKGTFDRLILPPLKRQGASDIGDGQGDRSTGL